jgi:integrase
MACKLRKLKGRWYLAIDHKGQRKTKVMGSSRSVAEDVRRKVEARLALGDLGMLGSESDYPTFDDYTKRWFTQHVDLHLKASSGANYRQHLRLYVSPTFGEKHLNAIRRGDVKQWLADLTAKELARNTVRLALCALRVVLTHAVDDGLIESNPCARLGKFTKTEKPAREAYALSRQEAEAFLQAAADSTPDYYPLFLVALRCGLRKGELIALRWGDIQLGFDENDSNRYLLVQRNFSHGRFTTPKGKRSRRVDLSKQTRRILAELKDTRLIDAIQMGKASIAEDLVFPARSGEKRDEDNPLRPSGRRLDPSKPLDPNNLVHYHFHPTLEAAGLRRFRFHDLRHTFGSLLIQDGASLAYVRDQMGRSSIKITADCYGHLVPGANISWVDRLDEPSLRKTNTQESANQTQMISEGEEEDSGEPLEPTEQIEDIGERGRNRTFNLLIKSRKSLIFTGLADISDYVMMPLISNGNHIYTLRETHPFSYDLIRRRSI